MDFKEVRAVVGGTPFISERNARYLYDLILNESVSDVLELGIAHGAGTCYIAAALEKRGAGKVTSVDLKAVSFDPSAEDMIRRCGLGHRVEIVRMQTGYNWYLHDKIVRQSKGGLCEECYDLCILDGPKNWTIDSSAFFLVDKLLRENGRIIFDDYNWTYAAASARRAETDGITHRALSEDELTTPHIKHIVDYLVIQHPSYGKITLIDDGNWVVAHKIKASNKTTEYRTTYSPMELVWRGLKLVQNKLHL